MLPSRCDVLVCVYVNKHGDYGPNLDRKLVQQLPDHFGPAPVNAVLQQAVQACVDCTYQPSVLLAFLQSQSHTGGEVIRGKRSKQGFYLWEETKCIQCEVIQKQRRGADSHI